MNAIEIRNLCKTYGAFSLDHISFDLPRGCILGLIGQNGAGKSTTIRLILDMIARDSGEIRVLGEAVERRNARLRERIGVVLDEIGFPDCLSAKRLNKVLSSIYTNWDSEVYFGYLSQMCLPENKPFGEFSRGMKMKLGIAAALSHHPELLILDEATSGLDPVVRDEILEIFSEFTRDETRSVLISSHIVSDLEKLCDYVVFLKDGKLLLCAEKDRLLETYALIHCAPEELSKISSSAVLGYRQTQYGVEAVAQRSAIPTEMVLSPIGLEELFICFAKGETK